MHRRHVRKTIFGSNNGLTKAPLVFVGRRVQLFKCWRHAQNADIADFTGVLLRYPFTSVFYDSERRGGREEIWLSDERRYDLYWARLSREPGLALRLDTARRYVGVASLIDEGFLGASPDYLDWARAQRNGARVFKSHFARPRMKIQSIRAPRLQTWIFP
jgi:hypothetical protein